MTQKTILAVCALAVLAGCGGGSSSSTTTGDETHATSGGDTGGTTAAGDGTAGTTGDGATTPAGDGGATTGSGGDAFATRVASGQEKFDHVCGTCHPNGDEDTGPDLHNKHLTVAQVTNQIRNGSSHMRPIPVARLSDEELPNVLAWLSTIGTVDGLPH